MTRALLRTRVSGAIGLNNISGSEEQQLIDGWLDEGAEQLLLETRIQIDIAELPLTAGSSDYDLPSDVLLLHRVLLREENGTETPLLPMDADEILERRRFTPSGSGPVYYTLQGATLVMVYPAALAGQSLVVYFVPKPAAWAGANDSPAEVPGWAHPAIEVYAKWKAAEYDDKTTAQTAEDYAKQWEDWVRKVRSRMTRARGPLAPARPGRRRRIPVSPGVDWFPR